MGSRPYCGVRGDNKDAMTFEEDRGWADVAFQLRAYGGRVTIFQESLLDIRTSD